MSVLRVEKVVVNSCRTWVLVYSVSGLLGVRAMCSMCVTEFQRNILPTSTY